MQGIENNIQFDQWCAAHTIDERKDLLTRLKTQVFDDRSSKHFSNFGGRSKLDTATPWLTMNTDADLHLIFTQFKGWFASSRDSTGVKGHTHTAALFVDFARQCRDCAERCTCLCQATNDLFKQNGNTHTTSARGIQTILHSHIIIGHHAGNLNSFSGSQFRGHLEIQYVTSVIFDYMQYTGTTIYGTGS